MKMKTIKKDGYNLHLIKETKYKTILTKVVFWEPIKEEEITIRNALIDNLLFSSNDYKSHKELIIKQEELYGINIQGANYRKGNYIFSELSVSAIEDKYTKQGNLEKAYELFFNLIEKPNVTENKFSSEGFNINTEYLKARIASAKEKPAYYSLIEYKNLLGKNKSFAIPLEGTLEDLEKLNEEKLYNYYQKFIKNNNIDIFVTGNLNYEQIEKLIEKYFNLKQKENKIKELYPAYEKEFTETKQTSKFSQSRLVLGGTTANLEKHERKYESLVFNIIFGSSPNSKLFKNVREKHSYAYSITSSFIRLDQMFYVIAGISKGNYEATKDLILHELEEMKKGKFTKKDVKEAKEVILGLIDEIEDYQGGLLDHYFNYLYMESDDLKTQKEEIKKITKEDIIKVAQKINIDTILFVEEDENENN